MDNDSDMEEERETKSRGEGQLDREYAFEWKREVISLCPDYEQIATT